jgi:hypothetical protein
MSQCTPTQHIHTKRCTKLQLLGQRNSDVPLHSRVTIDKNKYIVCFETVKRRWLESVFWPWSSIWLKINDFSYFLKKWGNCNVFTINYKYLRIQICVSVWTLYNVHMHQKSQGTAYVHILCVNSKYCEIQIGIMTAHFY